MTDLIPGTVIRETDLDPTFRIKAPGMDSQGVVVLVGPIGATGPAGADGVDGDVPPTRTITAGTGLTGGGDLSANRSLAADFGTAAGKIAQGNDSRITGAAQKSSNLSDLASASTARTNLGLGTAATKNTGTGAGQIPVLSGTPGTPDGTKFYRDDGTWAAAGGGGGGVLASTQYNPSSTTTVTRASATWADLDATNLTVTFTAPATGQVIVSLSAGYLTASQGNPGLWGLGVAGTLTSGTEGKVGGAASDSGRHVHRVKVTGLTPGASVTYRWMHAQVQTGTLTTQFGGTDTAALGPAIMEVWSA